VKAVIINKFRGDAEILKPGLKMLEDRINIPVLSVIPFMDIDLEDEDSVTERFCRNTTAGAAVKIGIVRLPYMSNFTDFNMLYNESGVGIQYITNPAQIADKDLLIIPGSKNTIGDLRFIQKNGLGAEIIRYANEGGMLMGICGGYQMLGKRINDPDGSETDAGKAQGLGLLDFDVTLQKEKVTAQSKGKIAFGGQGFFNNLNGCCVEGYEIHMGQNEYGPDAFPVAYLYIQGGTKAHVLDMVCNPESNVFGTYLHGIFDNGTFMRGLVNHLRSKKRLDAIQDDIISFAEYKEREYDKLADIVRNNSDMELFYHILNSI
ncbi:MAG: cobyric acid synthase, partial [Eubacteriales bacterium]